MAKNKDEVKRFIEALEDAMYEPKSYSGRGMYGKCCVSISEEGVSAWDIARALWFNNLDEEDLDIPEPLQDQLGRGYILYWPSYEWPKDE
jgi:hypothetical protein